MKGPDNNKENAVISKYLSAEGLRIRNGGMQKSEILKSRILKSEILKSGILKSRVRNSEMNNNRTQNNRTQNNRTQNNTIRNSGRKKIMNAKGLFSAAFVTLLSALFCWGCTNGKKTAQPRPETEESGGAEMGGHGLDENNKGSDEGVEETEEDLKVEGLLGTIDEQAVAKAFSKKSYEIEQCILGNVKAMPYVTGKMDLHFDVAPNGDVTVKLLENTMGNYKVEECLFKIASSLHFGKPKGGTAKVGYPLSVPHRGTPHEKWSKSKVRREMRSNRRAIRKCRKRGKPRSFSLHFYVLPGGRMTSLGVHADEGLPPGFAACVFDALKDVTFPDTFGKVAKVKYDF